MVVGVSVTVSVPNELYVHASGVALPANPFGGARPTEEDIRDRAVSRLICTGYKVGDSSTVTASSGGANTSYTFVAPDGNVEIVFHWKIDMPCRLNRV